MNPSLSWHIDAVRDRRISSEKARAFIEDWPAYKPGEQAEKAAALEELAKVEIARLRASLRGRLNAE
jgi:hypothetical protein